jgi:hypothetical protein
MLVQHRAPARAPFSRRFSLRASLLSALCGLLLISAVLLQGCGSAGGNPTRKTLTLNAWEQSLTDNGNLTWVAGRCGDDPLSFEFYYPAGSPTPATDSVTVTLERHMSDWRSPVMWNQNLPWTPALWAANPPVLLFPLPSITVNASSNPPLSVGWNRVAFSGASVVDPGYDQTQGGLDWNATATYDSGAIKIEHYRGTPDVLRPTALGDALNFSQTPYAHHTLGGPNNPYNHGQDTQMNNDFWFRCPLDYETGTCEPEPLCFSYSMPMLHYWPWIDYFQNQAPQPTWAGTLVISVDIYQDGVLVGTVNSPTLTATQTVDTYCFNTAQILALPGLQGPSSAHPGFDFVARGTFTTVNGPEVDTYSIMDGTAGNDAEGPVAGFNNDYKFEEFCNGDPGPCGRPVGPIATLGLFEGATDNAVGNVSLSIDANQNLVITTTSTGGTTIAGVKLFLGPNTPESANAGMGPQTAPRGWQPQMMQDFGWGPYMHTSFAAGITSDTFTIPLAAIGAACGNSCDGPLMTYNLAVHVDVVKGGKAGTATAWRAGRRVPLPGQSGKKFKSYDNGSLLFGACGFGQ